MRKHHPHDRVDKLVRGDPPKLFNAHFYVAHADFSHFILFVGQALNHERHQLGQVVHELIEAVRKEQQHASIGLSDASFL